MAATAPTPLRAVGSIAGPLGSKPTAAPLKRPSAPVSPLAALFAPVDSTALAGQATDLAHANTAPIIAGLQGQQAYDTQLAGQRAGQDTSASIAAAKFLQGLGLGPKLGAMYRQAGQDQAGLAAGFSGDLQRTVGDQAAHVNAGLAALGLTGAASNTSAQAGNTVYGVGGLIPANAMLASAPAAVAAANAQPAALLGVGQQAASSEIGAGAQAAAKIDPQIAAALAKEPALASTYLGQFTKAAETGRQNNISDYIRQEGVDASQSYHTAELHIQAVKANNDAAYKTAQLAATKAYRSGQLSVAEFKATTAANKAAATAANPDSTLSGKVGMLVNPAGQPIPGADGKPQILPGFKPGANGLPVKVATGSAKGSLSQKNIIGLVDEWAHPPTHSQRVAVLNPDGTPVTNSNGVPQYVTKSVPTQSALSFIDATKGLIAHGVSQAQAFSAVLANPTYAAQAQTQITQAAQLYAQNGTPLRDALKELSAYVPVSLAGPVLRSAYAHQATLTKQARGLGLRGTAGPRGNAPSPAALPVGAGPTGGSDTLAAAAALTGQRG